VRTLGLQGRTEPLRLFGPKGAQRILTQALELGFERVPFPIAIEELKPGDRVPRAGYDLEVIPADHGSGAVSYVLREHQRLGRFDPEQARALGVPEGPLWGRLHKGEAVEWEVRRDDGSTDRRMADPSTLVGAPRPGRVVAISGDTRPNAALVEAAMGADLLVHEATFTHDEHDRALETRHSTAREAAQVALAARVKRLVLTHLSARFSMQWQDLLDEARAVFQETEVAKDGMVVEVPFQDA